MEDIILTPIQVQDLTKKLEEVKLKLKNAKANIKDYKNVEGYKIPYEDGFSNCFLDSSYYEEIVRLSAEVDELESLLGNYVLAVPTGDTVQFGSIVELADRDLRFMVVQKKIITNSSIMEVDMEAPIFDAIYNRKAFDVCECDARGKQLSFVISNVDNSFSYDMASSMTENLVSAKTHRL